MQKRSRNGKRAGKRGKSRKQKSLHEKWMSELIKLGAYRQSSSGGDKQLIIMYSAGQIPPRMPSPGGPTKGASLTMTQFVRGSDMTLPTGTAIVGALLRQSSASDVFASFAFALADIPNIASVGALFDQYRIDQIQFRLRSKNPAIFIANSASPNYGTATPLIAIDRDDNTAPTTVLEVQQYDNCQMMSAQDSIDIVLTPSITPAVFSGGAFNGYAVDDGGKYWLDVANTGIPHYGIKVAIPALVATTTQRFDWDVEGIYKVSFRNVR